MWEFSGAISKTIKNKTLLASYSSNTVLEGNNWASRDQQARVIEWSVVGHVVGDAEMFKHKCTIIHIASELRIKVVAFKDITVALSTSYHLYKPFFRECRRQYVVKCRWALCSHVVTSIVLPHVYYVWDRGMPFCLWC